MWGARSRVGIRPFRRVLLRANSAFRAIASRFPNLYVAVKSKISENLKVWLFESFAMNRGIFAPKVEGARAVKGRCQLVRVKSPAGLLGALGCHQTVTVQMDLFEFWW